MTDATHTSADMNRFASLLDRLAYEPGRNNKLRLMTNYFRNVPDPERGYALAAFTGGLDFPNAKPALIRALIAERTDPVLFGLSYDYVGDLSETVALMWPARDGGEPPPTLAEVVETLRTTGKLNLGKKIAAWLDALDETGRWALLKLMTGALRIGVSARLAKTAVADMGGLGPNDVEEVWNSLSPPYGELFAWVEGRAPKPDTSDPAPFRTPMLAHAIEEHELAALEPAEFVAEWKWDGIRVQAAVGRDASARTVARLHSRAGEDISGAFPDLIEALRRDDSGAFALDGELLVRTEAGIGTFNELQQRLNRKAVSSLLLARYPAHIRAYDLLSEHEVDLRPLPFVERRARLEGFVARFGSERLDVSPLVPFATWEELAQARRDPAAHGVSGDIAAIEGVMLKRRDSIYEPGRPKGLWYKWKRDPHTVDAVLMYAQRGHGKRSSFYSDFTFGVWEGEGEAMSLVPVGKAYFGFTDTELAQLDRYVRNNTGNRFGPVREVLHGPDHGLVLEIAFEGLNRSTRHRSGIAMRFPRIARIRWDKPAREADTLASLEKLLKDR